MTIQQYSHPFPAPTDYDAADPFGNIRASGLKHLGSDYKKAAGTPIYAVSDGHIVLTDWSGVVGNVAEQQNDDGIFFGYAHMYAASPLADGARVLRGQTVIGYVGNTGAASKGNHLHLSCGTTIETVFGGGRLFDPWASIQAHLAAPPTPQPEEQEMDLLYYKDAETQIVYARDVTDLTAQLCIVGKNPSATVAFTTAKLDPNKILIVSGEQMAKLVAMYGVQPVSPAAFAVWSRNRPLVKGLVSA